jgi:hypothetical protein
MALALLTPVVEPKRPQAPIIASVTICQEIAL